MTNGPALTSHAAFARNLECVDAGRRVSPSTLERVSARDVLTAGIYGEWSAKDLAAHVSIRDNLSARWMRALIDDDPDPRVRDIDAFNAGEADLRAEHDIAQLMAELDTNHERVREALDRAHGGTASSWVALRYLEAYTWGHYSEHGQQIDAVSSGVTHSS